MAETVTGILEQIANEFCDHYCKYPDKYSSAEYEDMLDEKCDKCPLQRL